LAEDCQALAYCFNHSPLIYLAPRCAAALSRHKIVVNQLLPDLSRQLFKGLPVKFDSFIGAEAE
jgi:hypothetical protein